MNEAFVFNEIKILDLIFKFASFAALDIEFDSGMMGERYKRIGKILFIMVQLREQAYSVNILHQFFRCYGNSVNPTQFAFIKNRKIVTREITV